MTGSLAGLVEWVAPLKGPSSGCRLSPQPLEGFARQCESGAVTVEDAERHAVMSERYFRPPNGFFFA